MGEGQSHAGFVLILRFECQRQVGQNNHNPILCIAKHQAITSLYASEQVATVGFQHTRLYSSDANKVA